MQANTKRIVVDNELRSLIPPLGDEELSQLELNVVKDGCRDPLIVWSRDGGTACVLIDGHNRFEICKRRDITFTVSEMKFDSRDKVILWMIENQMGRRNLSDIDRIALAQRREAIIRPLAKENQTVAMKGPRGQRSGKIAETSIDTRRESAKAAGVGERTYDAGKMILEAASKGEIDQSEVEAIRRKEKSIHRVAKDLKEKRQQQKRSESRRDAVQKAEPQFFDNVHIGDFRDHFDKVPDNSLSLIFTDPPYDRGAKDLYPSLADFAESKLCDGGSLIVYTGHLQLQNAINCLSSKLRHWWTLCCLHADGSSLMREYGIRVGWKPVVWFVKGTRDDKSNIVTDVMSGGREKTHHDWQQSQAEAEYWISELCPNDGVVCDPFLGGGTTAAAAIKLKRKWVAFEIDHDQAVVAMGRCKN